VATIALQIESSTTLCWYQKNIDMRNVKKTLVAAASKCIYKNKFKVVRCCVRNIVIHIPPEKDTFTHFLNLVNPNNIMVDTGHYLVKYFIKHKKVSFKKAVDRTRAIIGPFDLRDEYCISWCYKLYDPTDLTLAVSLGANINARVHRASVMATLLWDMVTECHSERYNKYNGIYYTKCLLAGDSNNMDQEKLNWLFAAGAQLDVSMITHLEVGADWIAFLKSRSDTKNLLDNVSLLA
jgi:hypothetical protein